jgi:hypothetical protein
MRRGEEYRVHKILLLRWRAGLCVRPPWAVVLSCHADSQTDRQTDGWRHCEVQVQVQHVGKVMVMVQVQVQGQGSLLDLDSNRVKGQVTFLSQHSDSTLPTAQTQSAGRSSLSACGVARHSVLRAPRRDAVPCRDAASWAPAWPRPLFPRRRLGACRHVSRDATRPVRLVPLSWPSSCLAVLRGRCGAARCRRCRAVQKQAAEDALVPDTPAPFSSRRTAYPGSVPTCCLS